MTDTRRPCSRNTGMRRVSRVVLPEPLQPASPITFIFFHAPEPASRREPSPNPVITRDGATKQSGVAREAQGCFAEPVIGPRFAPTGWLAMTAGTRFVHARQALYRSGNPVMLSCAYDGDREKTCPPHPAQSAGSAADPARRWLRPD